MKILHIVSFLLLVIGGLNWGLMGLIDLNLVTRFLGSWPVVVDVVYTVIGVAAVLELLTHKKHCKTCGR